MSSREYDRRIFVWHAKKLGWRYRIDEFDQEDGHYVDRGAALEAGQIWLDKRAADEREAVERGGE